MAIVKMKKLRVVAMAQEREALLEELLHLGCVEISEPTALPDDPAACLLPQGGSEEISGPNNVMDDPNLLRREDSRLMETRGAIADANTALAAIRRYASVKQGMFIKRRPIRESDFMGSAAVDGAKEICEKINGLLTKLVLTQSEADRLRAKRAALLPWAELDLPLGIRDTAHVLIRMGVCPAATDVDALRAQLGDLAAELIFVNVDKAQQYLLLVCHRSDEAAVMELLKPVNFSQVTFPEYSEKPAEELHALDQAIAEHQAEQERITNELSTCGGAKEALEVYADRLSTEAGKDSDTQRLLTDGTIVFFEGWFPATSEKTLAALLNSRDCAWEARDPTPEEYPEVPVKLKNNWLTKPLNMVTEMYSLPAYGSVDPNPLMAPFFIFFYGFMLADMGYGLLMMIAAAVVLKKYRPKGGMEYFFSLLGLCGITTFVMGAITGGFFGDFLPQLVRLINPNSTFELPSLFTPLNDTLSILIGSMCLGFIQVVTGMAVDFVKKAKRGQLADAIWDDATWWVIYAGVPLAIFGIGNVAGVPVVLAVGGVMLVIGSSRNAKGLGKLAAVIGAVYNGVTGIFGDVLSYSRLMALMLAGSVIAQVFNTLGAIPGNIVIFLIISIAGNALNFALNLLGCYVHDLRLQCLEYFGKFYEDGGKPFRPMAIQTKYVDIVNE